MYFVLIEGIHPYRVVLEDGEEHKGKWEVQGLTSSVSRILDPLTHSNVLKFKTPGMCVAELLALVLNSYWSMGSREDT